MKADAKSGVGLFVDMTKAYEVYVLWSDAGRCFYIGVSEDVATRLAQHNSGVSKWTKRWAGSWSLVWSRPFESLGAAREFENRLKRQKAGTGFYRMTGLDPDEFPKSGS